MNEITPTTNEERLKTERILDYIDTCQDPITNNSRGHLLDACINSAKFELAYLLDNNHGMEDIESWIVPKEHASSVLIAASIMELSSAIRDLPGNG